MDPWLIVRTISILGKKRRDSPDTLAALGTQYTAHKQTKDKTQNKQDETQNHQKLTRTHVLVKSKQLQPLIRLAMLLISVINKYYI